MKKLVCLLVALFVCLASVAMAATDSPSIDSPSIDSPSIDNPSIDKPGTDSPSIDSPSIDSPSIDSPDIDSPSIDNPSAGSSSAAGIVVKIDNDADFAKKVAEQLAKLAQMKDVSPDTYIADYFASEKLAAAVAEAFGADAKLVVGEFVAISVSGFDPVKHANVVVKAAITFPVSYTQEKVVAMVGTFNADDSMTWTPVVCDVENGAVVLALDAEVLTQINNGKAIVSVLSAAE